MTDEPPASPDPFRQVDPFDLARREKAAAQLKRFYKAATIAELDGAFAPVLDGRPIKTPSRNFVRLPVRGAAQRLADEWNAQGEVILPATMPLTRLVNSSIDGVAGKMAEVAAEIVRFASSDLLCYRGAEPEILVQRQAEAWDPVLAWSRDAHGARFYLAEGVMFVSQPEEALAAIAAAIKSGVGVGDPAPFRLAALHVMTTLTGSALLALAVLSGALRAEEAWRKAHVDEDFQIERWGQDMEAEERRAHRWADMKAAADLAALLDI